MNISKNNFILITLAIAVLIFLSPLLIGLFFTTLGLAIRLILSAIPFILIFAIYKIFIPKTIQQEIKMNVVSFFEKLKK